MKRSLLRHSAIPTLRRSATLILGVLLTASALAQGSLTPPAGPPQPTMKRLDQIEARIPLETLPGNTLATHVITQPGNYYLTGDVVGQVGKHGILILTNDCTLDLNGFTVRGAPGALDGISRPFSEGDPELERCRIQNGTIRDWPGRGIQLLSYHQIVLNLLFVQSCNLGGIQISGDQVAVENCHVRFTKRFGIQLTGNPNHRVTNCQVIGVTSVASNDDLVGIHITYGSVDHCLVNGVNHSSPGGTSTARGIAVDEIGMVRNCDVTTIGVGAAFGAAITASDVVDCQVNSVLASSSSGKAFGILVGESSTKKGRVHGCSVTAVSGYEAYGIAETTTPQARLSNSTLPVDYRIEHCQVGEVTGTGNFTCGILARHVSDCSATGITSNGVYGIGIATVAGTVERCSVRRVNNSGIYLNLGSTALDCKVVEAGLVSTTAAGVFMQNDDNSAEGCHVSKSRVGFWAFNAAKNILIRNVALSNTTNFQLDPQAIAPLISTPASAASATNPLANLAY